MSLDTLGSKSINFGTDISAWLNETTEFFMYEGSYSFPDCAENVLWVVINKNFLTEDSVITTIDTLYRNNTSFGGKDGNARVIQETNRRDIRKGGGSCDDSWGYIIAFIFIYALV